MKLTTIILAAGQGSRMNSQKPKVLHTLAGKPLLSHVIKTAEKVSQQIIVVYGFGGNQIKKYLDENHPACDKKEQIKQKGTAHAVLTAIDHVKHENILVLYGDVPLISEQEICLFKQTLSQSDISFLTVDQDNPTGYGRIVRNFAGNPFLIVEEKDATEEQKSIKEVNSGILGAKTQILKKLLKLVKNENAQKEYYLPDVLGFAVDKNLVVRTKKVDDPRDVDGVNTQIQLSKLERIYQRRLAEKLASEGVHISDLNRLDVRGTVSFGKNCTIDVNVILEGEVSIGDGCYIGPSVFIKDSKIGSRCMIRNNSFLEGADIKEGAEIGPFARIRPETKTEKNVKIGSFVETKKTFIGESSKVNHLTYIGDARLGRFVNVGAGTITCNYDGETKHETLIGNNVFIGSGTQFVAPVEIGDNVTIGAGSTIRTSVMEGCLSLSEKKQKTIESWKRKKT